MRSLCNAILIARQAKEMPMAACLDSLALRKMYVPETGLFGDLREFPVGAMRRPQLKEEAREDFVTAESPEEPPPTLYPRWIVVPCVVLYCTVFWALVWIAGTSGVDWVRTAAAGAQ